jgi:hypothetical protein
VQYLAHRLVWILALVTWAFPLPASAGSTPVTCLKEGETFCEGNPSGCFHRGLKRVFLACETPEIRKAVDGITCDQIPKPRADGDLLNVRCILKHECDHAEVFQQEMGLNLCAAEFSAYLQGARCLREAQKAYCPDGIPAWDCASLSEEEKGDRLVMEFLRCKQRGGSKTICETQCLLSGAKLLGKANARGFCASVFDNLGNCENEKF